MEMVDAMTDQTDKHGLPVGYKAANALGTVLRASESRRRLYGVDAPTRIGTTFVPEMTEEEATAILAEHEMTRRTPDR